MSKGKRINPFTSDESCITTTKKQKIKRRTSDNNALNALTLAMLMNPLRRKATQSPEKTCRSCNSSQSDTYKCEGCATHICDTCLFHCANEEHHSDYAYCSSCVVINYDQREERFFCLDCARQE